MTKKVKKNKQQHGNQVIHKRTYGSGFSGAMGKVAKVLLVSVVILAIAGAIYARWDYNNDSDISTPVKEQVERVN